MNDDISGEAVAGWTLWPPRADTATVAYDDGFRHTEAVQAVTARVPGSTGAELTAVYVPAAGGGELQLAEMVGGSGAPYGLPTGFELSGSSPVAAAFRTGVPLWLSPAELAQYGVTGPPGSPGAEPWDGSGAL